MSVNSNLMSWNMPTVMCLFTTKFNLLCLSQCLCPCLTNFFSFNCDVKDIQLCFQVVQVSIWRIVIKILQVFISVPSRLLKRIIFKKCFIIMKSISKSRSCSELFCKKTILKNFAIFTGGETTTQMFSCE